MANVDVEKAAAETVESIQDMTVPVLSTRRKPTADNEKDPFGATVQPVSPDTAPPQNLYLKPVHSHEAPSSPASIASSFDARPPNALSPFYNHPPCSFEQPSSGKTSKTRLAGCGYPVDGQYHNESEAVLSLGASPKLSVQLTRDCAMWPSQKELKRRAKADKKTKRRCLPRLSKKARTIIAVVALLLVIGIALILGFVISKKVGGGVYASPSEPNQPIP